MKKIAFILALAASVSFCADQLIIAAGGGYKKPVSAVIENLKKEGMDVAGSFATSASSSFSRARIKFHSSWATRRF